VDEAIRDLLQGSDDPVNEEEPPNLTGTHCVIV
jgi:hypothetical protein